MNLHPEEPFFGPWQPQALADFTTALLQPLSERKIIAVDGRSAGGKTTLAGKLESSIPGSVVVHIDDIPMSGSWRGSEAQAGILSDPIPAGLHFFDWPNTVIKNLFEPYLAGKAVHYRPESWDDWNRPEGAIKIPPACPALILEGVFTGRYEISEYVDKIIWVQSDFEKARSRGIERDGGDAESEKHWNRFESFEAPFFAEQKSWERADVVVCGTPETPHAADEVMISSEDN